MYVYTTLDPEAAHQWSASYWGNAFGKHYSFLHIRGGKSKRRRKAVPDITKWTWSQKYGNLCGNKPNRSYRVLLLLLLFFYECRWRWWKEWFITPMIGHLEDIIEHWPHTRFAWRKRKLHTKWCRWRCLKILTILCDWCQISFALLPLRRGIWLI